MPCHTWRTSIHFTASQVFLSGSNHANYHRFYIILFSIKLKSITFSLFTLMHAILGYGNGVLELKRKVKYRKVYYLFIEARLKMMIGWNE